MKHYTLKKKHETVWGWSNRPVTFRKGATCVPADNLPKGGFWIRDFAIGHSRNTDFLSWQFHYGFWVSAEEVQEADASVLISDCPFAEG
jgi:hypothetical protein